MAENKVRFGICNVHYALATVADDGSVTYGAWKALPNAVSITADPNTNTSTQYADNVLIYSKTSLTGTNITLTMSTISDEFKKEVLGWKSTGNGGLIQPADAITQYIALGYQIEGDQKSSKRWFFLCSVSDPNNDDAQTTTDSITFSNEALTLTAYPVKIGDKRYLKEKIAEGSTGYASMFSGTPTLPTISA